ncbi:MAG: glycosyltransferase, partial [Bacteroidota bacterium]|nr:glycosyltransferase [Bacteroidota bacterium]
GESFIADAINSVLAQKYHPLELIVIDDGSTDKTQQVAKTFGDKIIYIRQENKGVASARNKGIKLVKSKFVAFIDADDLWTNNKLEQQLDIFATKPDSEIVIGFTQRIPVTMNAISAEQEPNPKVLLLYNLGCTLIRKSVFDKIGNFDEDLLLSEDTDWFFRAMEANIPIELHRDIVQYYRFHQNNITNDKKRDHLYQIKAYKKSLDRRRKSGDGSVPAFPKPGNLDEMIKYWKLKETEKEIKNKNNE